MTIPILTIILSPVLVLLVFQTLRLLRHIYTVIVHAPQLPEPALAWYKRFTVGHNLLYYFIHAESQETADYFNAISAKHGDVFVQRSILGTANIIAKSGSAVRRISMQQHLRYEKSPQFRRALDGTVGSDGILLAEGEQHAHLRRAVSPAMHYDALCAVSAVFFKRGRELASGLFARQTDADFDVLHEVRKRTFDVIVDACFGEEAMSREEKDALRRAYLSVFLEPPNSMMRRALLQSFFSFLSPRVFDYRADLKQYIRDTVRGLCRRALQEPERAPVGTPLIRLMHDGERGVGEREMVDTVLSFLAAGQATSSICICWTLYLLARDAGQQAMVVEALEGRRDVDDMDELDGVDVLHRVVKEALRLYPPVAVTGRALVVDDELDGRRVAAGTSVRVPILAMQTDARVWGDDCLAFRPQRWLDAETRRVGKTFWLPFWAGARGCVGQRFAMLEIKTFVAEVLTGFEVALVGDEAVKAFGTVMTPRGLRLRLRRRSGRGGCRRNECVKMARELTDFDSAAMECSGID